MFSPALLLAWLAGVSADSVRSYVERVTLDSAATRVTVEVTLDLPPSGESTVTIGWPMDARAQLVHPDGIDVVIVPGDPLSRLIVRGAAGSRAAVSASFDEAAVRDAFAHRLVNTGVAVITDYRLLVVLPPQRLARLATFEVPPGDAPAGATPLILDVGNGRRVVRLDAPRVAPGEAVALDVELSPDRPPMEVFAFAAAVAVLYLVAFRDLVRPPAGFRPTTPARTPDRPSGERLPSSEHGERPVPRARSDQDL